MNLAETMALTALVLSLGQFIGNAFRKRIVCDEILAKLIIVAENTEEYVKITPGKIDTRTRWKRKGYGI